MLTHEILAVLARTEQTRHPTPVGLIALSCNEIARLFNRPVIALAGGGAMIAHGFVDRAIQDVDLFRPA